jgi:hypothetical protein
MNPSGKGELAVPVKYLYEKCKRKYETIRVDERNTTKMHHKCEGRTGCQRYKRFTMVSNLK